MAYKKINTTFKKSELGAVHEGYLVSVGSQEFAAKVSGGSPTIVPTMILQDKKSGERFKILLGTTVREDVALLKLGIMTKVQKAKESKKTNAGNNVIEWDLSQDSEDIYQVK